ncbi:MAG: hypothetical protein ACTHJ9_10155 [Rhodanobacter sp.]
MALATAYIKNSLATKYSTEALYAALYTTAPGSSAGTEVTGGSPAYARKALTWSAPSNGQITASATFDVPACTVVGSGFHTASTAGTYVDGFSVASTTFAGQDTLTVSYTFTES